jgi:uncharacterized metal-binding protein
LNKKEPVCDVCTTYTCYKDDTMDNAPAFCVTKNNNEVLKETFSRYKSGVNNVVAKAVYRVSRKSNRRWTRIRVTIEFAKEIKAKKIGVAFCIGLRYEAKKLCEILRAHDFQVVSVCCQVGGSRRLEGEVTETGPLLCNPLAQVEILNRAKTDLNITVGLCVGDDALFMKYSDALATTLISKDKVLCHNPVGPLTHAYGYYRDKLPSKKGVKIHPSFK